MINLFCTEKDHNKVKKEDLLGNVKDNQSEIWCNFLIMKNKFFKNKHYHFHIQIFLVNDPNANWVSYCLSFLRKDLVDKKITVLEKLDFYNIEDLSKEQLETLKWRNIVGCVLGKGSLVSMMNKNGN